MVSPGGWQEISYSHLFDVFPWFVKDGKDYQAAGKLLAQYMNVARPLIVLTYGDIVYDSEFIYGKSFSLTDCSQLTLPCKRFQASLSMLTRQKRRLGRQPMALATLSVSFLEYRICPLSTPWKALPPAKRLS